MSVNSILRSHYPPWNSKECLWKILIGRWSFPFWNGFLCERFEAICSVRKSKRFSVRNPRCHPAQVSSERSPGSHQTLRKNGDCCNVVVQCQCSSQSGCQKSSFQKGGCKIWGRFQKGSSQENKCPQNNTKNQIVKKKYIYIY